MADDIVTSSFNIFDNSVAVIKNSSSNLDYFFKYRLVTDEGEALTQWSGVNQVTQGSISGILGNFLPSISASSVESNGVGMNVKWTTPNSFPTNKFDIYFSWSYNNGGVYTSFKYEDTVTSNNYYIDIPFVPIGIQTPTGTTNITFTTTVTHGIVSGKLVVLSGITPSGYNGTWVAQSGTTGSTLVLNMGSNPGPITTAGKTNKIANFIKIAVQVPTNLKIVNTNALLIQSNAISTLPILDPGLVV